MKKIFTLVTRSKAVNKFLSAIVLLTLAFSTLASGPVQRAQSQQVTDIPAESTPAPEKGTLYYYSDNCSIPLTVATNILMVRMAPNISVQGIAKYLIGSGIQLSAGEMAIQRLENNLNLVLFPQPATVETIMQAVANLSKAPNMSLLDRLLMPKMP